MGNFKTNGWEKANRGRANRKGVPGAPKKPSYRAEPRMQATLQPRRLPWCFLSGAASPQR